MQCMVGEKIPVLLYPSALRMCMPNALLSGTALFSLEDLEAGPGSPNRTARPTGDASAAPADDEDSAAARGIHLPLEHSVTKDVMRPCISTLERMGVQKWLPGTVGTKNAHMRSVRAHYMRMGNYGLHLRKELHQLSLYLSVQYSCGVDNG
jgi:hypothetical protein